jgi:hypothetical protein
MQRHTDSEPFSLASTSNIAFTFTIQCQVVVGVARWRHQKYHLTYESQLRRRNDGVECKAFRRFGRGTCPEIPHSW